MSAAQWRKAMNSGAGRRAFEMSAARAREPAGIGTARGAAGGAAANAAALAPADAAWAGPGSNESAWLRRIGQRISARHVLILLGLLVFPWLATPFFTYQIAAQSLVLGLIALSLTFLAGYGGMISLAQMTVAGVAGYTVAILGVNGTPGIDVDWPAWAVVPIALVLAVLASTFVGWLSVRTEGIYTIMITLAIGVAFYYLALQNYSVFNGFQGFQRVHAPSAFGVNWQEPLPFYFLSLFCALAGYFFVKYLLRAPFGIALQGIRDNPRRMNSLGFDVTSHRLVAYAVAGLIAGVGGVLLAI